MKRLLCAFETYDEGRQALTQAIVSGLPRDDVHLQPEAEFYAAPRSTAETTNMPAHDASPLRRCGRWLVEHFGMRVPPGEPGTYRDAVRRGATVVVVHVPDEQAARHAGALMASLGAFDVEVIGSGR